MKKSLILFAVGLWLIPFAAPGAQTALARMWCLSLRVQPGVDGFGISTFELSTLDSVSNGELAPTFSAVLSHGSGFSLQDPSGLGPVRGTMFVDVPFNSDANGNGFEDFFEVDQAVPPTATSGVFNSAGGNGTVQALWSRPAGSKDGMCTFRLTLNVGGFLGSFNHTFELLEYAGPLMYTPATNSVSGTVDLTEAGNPANRFTGSMQFLKALTNRFDRLQLQAGTWTNAAAQSLPFLDNQYFRDRVWPTNYYGYFDFDDGDLSTPGQDFQTWVLSIDDPNDSDRDRIPDFSDDLGSSAGRPPALALSLATTNLIFNLTGTVGRLHELQQTTSLTAPDWQTVSSVTLTNDPQAVTLPLPPGGINFWRVRAP